MIVATRRNGLTALVLSVVLLAGCQDDTPIVSGQVRAPGQTPRPLSAEQVTTLNEWLADHRSGWSRLVLATPPATSGLAIDVYRKSGRSGTLSFFSQEGWKGTLMYWGQDPGDNRQGNFGAEQVGALRHALEKAQ